MSYVIFCVSVLHIFVSCRVFGGCRLACDVMVILSVRLVFVVNLDSQGRHEGHVVQPVVWCRHVSFPGLVILHEDSTTGEWFIVVVQF